MFEKLAEVEKRLNEIELALQDGDLYNDPKRAAELLREQKATLEMLDEGVIVLDDDGREREVLAADVSVRGLMGYA